MKAIYKKQELGTIMGNYPDLANKPQINGVELLGDKTTEGIKVTWYGTQAEYDALPTINPNTIYIIDDGTSVATGGNYLDLSNKPSIEGQVLTGNKTANDLNMYNIPQIDLMFAELSSVNVVSALPALPAANALYFVGPDSEGFYDVTLFDKNRLPDYIGTTEKYIYTAGEAVEITKGATSRVIDVKYDADTMKVNADNELEPLVMTGATKTVAGKAGIVPAPAANEHESFLRGDGTWQEAPIVDFVGATATIKGKHGAVPEPQAGDQNKVLIGSKQWKEITADEGVKIDNFKITHTNAVPAKTVESLASISYDAQGHITDSTEVGVNRGINILANNIGHENSVTAKTTAALISATYDAQGHITASTDVGVDRGIDITSNKIGHTNAVTAKTAESLISATYDAQGHIVTSTDIDVDRGIDITANKIGHTNSITAQTTKALDQIAFDDHGHITGVTEIGVDRGLDITSNKIGHESEPGAKTVGEAASKIDIQFKVLNIETDDYGHVVDASEKLISVAEMTGATAATDGRSGLVPTPVKGDENKALLGDGTWGNVISDADDGIEIVAGVAKHVNHVASQATSKLMSLTYDSNGHIESSKDWWSGAELSFDTSGSDNVIMHDAKLGADKTVGDNTTTETVTFKVPKVVYNTYGHATAAEDKEITIATMTGATATAAGEKGLVPAPAAADNGKFLKGDGTWGEAVSDATDGIKIENNVAKHTNSVTADATTTLKSVTYDEFGHVTGKMDYTARNELEIGTVSGTEQAIQHVEKLAADVTVGTNTATSSVSVVVPEITFNKYGHATATKDTTVTIPVMTGATDTTVGAKGLVPTPAAGDDKKYLMGDGTWKTVQVDVMTGATATSDGEKGLVPKPNSADKDMFLRGDGNWARMTASNGIEIVDNDIKHPNTITQLTTETLSKITYNSTGHILSSTEVTADRGIDITGNAIGHTNSVTAAQVGPTADGNGLKVPTLEVTYDAQGHITAASAHEFAIDEMTGATPVADGVSGIVPTPVAGDDVKYLRGDGRWAEPPLPDDMIGATATTNGVHGLVIAPVAGEQNNFYRGDGTWQPISASTMVGATAVTDGAEGAAPKPVAGQEEYVLTGAATWVRMPKITVSSTAPTSAVAGDVWVKI